VKAHHSKHIKKQNLKLWGRERQPLSLRGDHPYFVP